MPEDSFIEQTLCLVGHRPQSPGETDLISARTDSPLPVLSYAAYPAALIPMTVFAMVPVSIGL